MNYAAELVLQGVYQGNDVFVRNPYSRETNDFCTQEVYVNDNLVFDNPMVSAFKITLSHLSIGDLVVIRIKHRDSCSPEIVNAHVLQPSGEFRILSYQANNNSLNWYTTGELPGGSFSIEQLQVIDKQPEWVKINEIPGKGDAKQNGYSVSPKHFMGENKYRIVYTDRQGKKYSTMDIAYTSTQDPVTFYPKSVTTKLTLSREVPYRITDRYGKLVKEGIGSIIFLQDLKPGEYFLEIENRTEKFVKK